MLKEKKEKKGSASISTIVITIFAIIVIIVLAFFYYYLAVKPYPEYNSFSNSEEILLVRNTPPKVESFATEVIHFVPPEILPSEIKRGDCQISSMAEPYRLDAFKCTSEKVAYDPCFSTNLSDIVYCKIKPSEQGGGFLMTLANPLPSPIIPKNINNSWAWFVVLEDGTEFSPYVGTRPMVDGEIAFYGSKITNGERTVLIGDLINGPVWTAQKKVLILSGLKWAAKSSEAETVRIKTVWQ